MQCHSRGQLSLELLLIYATVLSFLLILIPLISSTLHEGVLFFSQRSAQRYADRVSHAISFLCMSGSGSSITLDLPSSYTLSFRPSSFSVAYENKSGKKYSIERNAPCALETTEIKERETIVLFHDGSVIRVKP